MCDDHAWGADDQRGGGHLWSDEDADSDSDGADQQPWGVNTHGYGRGRFQAGLIGSGTIGKPFERCQGAFLSNLVKVCTPAPPPAPPAPLMITNDSRSC